MQSTIERFPLNKTLLLVAAILLAMLALQACSTNDDSAETQAPVVKVLEPRTSVETALHRAEIRLDELEGLLEELEGEAKMELRQTISELDTERQKLEATLDELNAETGESAVAMRNDLRTRLDSLEVDLARARYHAAATAAKLSTIVDDELEDSASELDSIEVALDSLSATTDTAKRDALQRARAGYDTLQSIWTRVENSSEDDFDELMEDMARASTELERRLREAEVVVNG